MTTRTITVAVAAGLGAAVLVVLAAQFGGG